MELLEIMRKRRSVRKYNGRPVSDEQIKTIIQAGMMAPSAKNGKPWEFIVIRDKETLKNLGLSRAEERNQNMAAAADVAITIIGNSSQTDTWVEDCSAAITQMHLMADALGLGSCWLQGNGRTSSDGRPTDEYLHELLGYPAHYKVLATLLVGQIDEHPAPTDLSSLPVEKIHYEKF